MRLIFWRSNPRANCLRHNIQQHWTVSTQGLTKWIALVVESVQRLDRTTWACQDFWAFVKAMAFAPAYFSTCSLF